jgi:hypothetical protein
MNIFTLIRPSHLAVWVAIVSAAGCTSKKDAPSMSPAAGPAAKQRSVWEPDPDRAKELSQSASLDKYELSLPKGFEPQPLAGAPPKGTRLVFWKGQAAGDRPPIVLIAMVMSSDAEVAEAKQNMRQALVNFSGGMANTSGIKIDKRGATDTGTIAGLAFSRFKWTGTTQDGGPANGMAYGAIDGPQVVLFLPMTFEANPDHDMRLMEAAMASLHRP